MACNIWFVRLFSVSLKHLSSTKTKDKDTIWRVEQLWLMGTTSLLKHCIIAWQRLHYCSGIYSYSCSFFSPLSLFFLFSSSSLPPKANQIAAAAAAHISN